MKKVIKDFYGTWEKNLSSIQREVMFFFSNFSVGVTILNLIFSQILYQYKKFTDIIEERPNIYNEMSQLLVSFNKLAEVMRSKLSMFE